MNASGVPMRPTTKCKVVCGGAHPESREVLVLMTSLVLDDEDVVYRFTCPVCGMVNAKPLDDGIRELLRGHGVPTVEELVTSFAAVLADDEAVGRAIDGVGPRA